MHILPFDKVVTKPKDIQNQQKGAKVSKLKKMFKIWTSGHLTPHTKTPQCPHYGN